MGAARRKRLLRPRAASVPRLHALFLASATVVENAPPGTVVGTVLGATAGSTVTLLDSAGGRFALAGESLVTGAVGLNRETATSHAVGLRETLTDYTNSPRDTTLTVSVTAVPVTLNPLELDGLGFTAGVSASGSVSGKTDGSTVSLVGSLPTGLMLDLTAMTWAWDGSGAVSSGTFTLRETIAEGTNSPRDSVQAWEIAETPPYVTPAVIKWAIEGTSLQGGGYAAELALDALEQDYENFSNGGSSTAAIKTRLLGGEASDCDGILLWTGGPNDLMTFATDAAALAAYIDLAETAHAAVGGGPTGIGGISPTDEVRWVPSGGPGGGAGFNNRRRYCNAGLRAFVAANPGGNYFYIPTGEHPLTAYSNNLTGASSVSAANTAANGGAGDYEADGGHPQPGSNTCDNEQAAIEAAVGAIIDQAGEAPATNPGAFTLVDITDSLTSTAKSSYAMLTGLGLGQSVTASVSGGPGTLARGYGATDTSAKALMAGDVLAATITSSGSYETALSSTYAAGNKSDTFTVTTQEEPPASPFVLKYSTPDIGSGAAVNVNVVAGRLYILSTWFHSGGLTVGGSATGVIALPISDYTFMYFYAYLATETGTKSFSAGRIGQIVEITGYTDFDDAYFTRFGAGTNAAEVTGPVIAMGRSNPGATMSNMTELGSIATPDLGTWYTWYSMETVIPAISDEANPTTVVAFGLT